MLEEISAPIIPVVEELDKEDPVKMFLAEDSPPPEDVMETNETEKVAEDSEMYFHLFNSS